MALAVPSLLLIAAFLASPALSAVMMAPPPSDALVLRNCDSEERWRGMPPHELIASLERLQRSDRASGCVVAVAMLMPSQNFATNVVPSSAADSRPDATRRWSHTTRSTAVIAGLYGAAFAIMWNLPEDHTNWERDELWDRFTSAFSKKPVWDNDDPLVNYLGHPLWGSYVYLSQRNMGESRWRSFLIATAHSIAFEYFVEAWTENPSAQDLLTTSPIGALIGEGVHRWTARMGRDGFNRRERIIITILNPAYRWQVGFK